MQASGTERYVRSRLWRKGDVQCYHPLITSIVRPCPSWAASATKRGLNCAIRSPSQLEEENVRGSLAFRVLEAVNHGERNPEVLKSIALRKLEA